MHASDIATVLTSLAFLLASGGWLANVGIKTAERRRAMAEAHKAEIDAGTALQTGPFQTYLGAAGATIDMLRKENERLAGRLTELERACQEHWRAETDCKEQLAVALAKLRL